MIFNKRNIGVLWLFFGLILLWPPHAFADERKWVLTEPYWTVSKGALELEEWYNASDSIADPPQNRIELEYGLTDHDQLAVYEVARQSDLSYGGYQVEYKRRLAQPGEFFLLPTAYFEYHNSTISGVPSEFEGKLIFEKYIGDLELATNFVWEKPLTGDDLSIHFDRFLLAGSFPIGDLLSRVSPNNRPTLEDLHAGLEYADYVHDQATTLTPDIFTHLSHNLQILGGYEIPLSGNVFPRFRIQMDWEFNR